MSFINCITNLAAEGIVSKEKQITLEELYLKELWYLYFFFKESIDGQHVKYSNIVAKYC